MLKCLVQKETLSIHQTSNYQLYINNFFLFQNRQSEAVFGINGLHPGSLFKLVMPFCILWSATNYCYLRALATVAATDVTALFSSWNAFVYIYSLLLLREPFLIFRVSCRVIGKKNSIWYWVIHLRKQHSNYTGCLTKMKLAWFDFALKIFSKAVCI